MTKTVTILLFASIIMLNSCSSNKAKNVSSKISLDEIESMPLIESHCHIDWDFENNPDIIQQQIELQKKEKLNYVLWIAQNWETTLKEAKKNKELAGVIPWINPYETDWKKLDSLIIENKDLIKGLKLHPTMDSYKIEYKLLAPAFKLANKHNILVVTHTDASNSPANKFRPLLEAFPQTKLILYHIAPVDEACQLVLDFPNVFVDISFTAFSKEVQKKVLAKVGKEKILFGIDSPLGFPKDENGFLPHYRDAAKEIAEFYDFDREVIEHIFYKNAEKLISGLGQ